MGLLESDHAIQVQVTELGFVLGGPCGYTGASLNIRILLRHVGYEYSCVLGKAQSLQQSDMQLGFLLSLRNPLQGKRLTQGGTP